MSRTRLITIALGVSVFSRLTVAPNTWAQPTAAESELPGIQAFDQFQIAAASLGVDTHRFVNDWTPEPSTSLARLINARPRMILVLKAGMTWQIKNVASESLQPVDPSAFSLGAQDLEVLVKMLDQPLLKHWAKCMREAWESKTGIDCLTSLADSVEKEPTPLHELLYANIGAKLISISVRNPAWQKLALSGSTPPAIERCLSSYKALESEKIMLAAGAAVGHPSRIAFAQLTNDQPWLDFASWSRSDDRTAQQVRTSGTPVTYWNVNSSMAYVLPTAKDRGLVKAVTISLTPDQYVILTGDLRKFSADQFKELGSVSEIQAFAKKQNLQVHLSRTGQATVGGF